MLTIDIGNSSIKWAIWQDGQPILAETDTYHKESIQQTFDGIFSGAPQQDSVWVACVASKDIEKALTEYARLRLSLSSIKSLPPMLERDSVSTLKAYWSSL